MATIRVGGHLSSPLYQVPLMGGMLACFLAPIAYGLDAADWNGVGRLRGIVWILRFVGPIFLLVGGVASLLFALAARMAIAGRFRDLEVGPDGFALIDREGRREFVDEQVIAVGLLPRTSPRGAGTEQRGRATVWVDAELGTEGLDLVWEYPDAGADPLAPFFERIVGRLTDQAEQAIESGGVVAGDGWQLTRLGLQASDADPATPFSEIAAAEYHEGDLKIWRRGQAEPSFRIARGSTNEAVLKTILERRMAATPDQPRVFNEWPADSVMGRLLFTRTSSTGDKVGLCLLLFILMAAVVVLGFATARGNVTPLVLVPAGVLAFLVLLAVVAIYRRRFQCYEGGIVCRGLFGTRELLYSEVARVKLVAMEGQWRVKFFPKPDSGRKKIFYDIKGRDDALETLRERFPEGFVS
jgi:hypothetical protein